MQGDVAWRRRLLLAAGIAPVAALCMGAILVIGPPTREASRDAGSEAGSRDTAQDGSTTEGPIPIDENEALVADARTYAKSMGTTSLEEAIRRLRMQGGASPSDLERELENSERDTFAGLRIRHKPDYGITVAAARDFEAVKEKVKAQVDGTKWEGTVRIKPAKATLVELNAARAEAERMLDGLRIRYSSGDNLYENRMETYVKDRAQVQRELRASGLKLPEHVVLIEDWGRPA